MRTIIYPLMIMTLLSSCTTSSTLVHVKKPVREKYKTMAAVYITGKKSLQSWNTDYYDNEVKNNFNSLSDARVRLQLEKTLVRNLSGNGLSLIPAAPLFSLDQPVTYDQFMKTIDSCGADAILLVDENAYWETPTYSVNGASVRYQGEPNSRFFVYLVDVKTGETKWIAESSIHGVFAGFDTINNTLARKIYQKLSEQGYIHP